jgi:hypothetical protein
MVTPSLPPLPVTMCWRPTSEVCIVVSFELEHSSRASTDSHMVDPDVASTIKSDGITTPDVLGVEFADGDVLDDNVVNATSKTQALSEKHALLSVTNDGLVALDLDRVERSLVVLDINACSAGLVVGAPTKRGSLKSAQRLDYPVRLHIPVSYQSSLLIATWQAEPVP